MPMSTRAPAASAEQFKTSTSAIDATSRDPVSLVRTGDATFTREGRFAHPPIVIAPDASRDDLIAVAASRAARLRDAIAFICDIGIEPVEDLAPADVARQFVDDAEDLAAILAATAERSA